MPVTGMITLGVLAGGGGSVGGVVGVLVGGMGVLPFSRNLIVLNGGLLLFFYGS